MTKITETSIKSTVHLEKQLNPRGSRTLADDDASARPPNLTSTSCDLDC